MSEQDRNADLSDEVAQFSVELGAFIERLQELDPKVIHFDILAAARKLEWTFQESGLVKK